MRILAVVALLVLAGCSENTGPTDAPLVTDDTGLIRGIVVDPAILPVEGARVQVLGGPNTTTDVDGAFQITGLAAGTYQLLVTKAGFFDGRKAAGVEAGVARPDLLKVVLEHDALGARYFEEQAHEGFVEWGFSAAGARGSNNDAPDLFFDRVPDHFQVEMVWESTQAFGEAMEITLIAFPPNSTTGDGFVVAQGTSPLHVAVDKDTLVAAGVGGDTRLSIAIFSAPSTYPVAVTVDQPFTLFIHSFYGYTPPEGWAFTQDGAAPP